MPQKYKSLKIFHFFANFKLALNKKDKVFILKKNILFPGWQVIVNNLYDLGYIYGYKETENSYEIYLNYYKNKVQIEEFSMLCNLKNANEFPIYKKSSFLNNHPRSTGFIRTQSGILSLKDAWKKRKKGSFIFYIR